MDFEQEQQFVSELKRYVTENLPLSRMSDEELEEKVEEIVKTEMEERRNNRYRQYLKLKEEFEGIEN